MKNNHGELKNLEESELAKELEICVDNGLPFHYHVDESKKANRILGLSIELY